MLSEILQLLEKVLDPQSSCNLEPGDTLSKWNTTSCTIISSMSTYILIIHILVVKYHMCTKISHLLSEILDYQESWKKTQWYYWRLKREREGIKRDKKTMWIVFLVCYSCHIVFIFQFVEIFLCLLLIFSKIILIIIELLIFWNRRCVAIYSINSKKIHIRHELNRNEILIPPVLKKIDKM